MKFEFFFIWEIITVYLSMKDSTRITINIRRITLNRYHIPKDSKNTQISSINHVFENYEYGIFSSYQLPFL
ncbi:hypothetical protein DERF_007693 [Dermatophagoides farinae]|uniref:Uncharacterized protein n=1 Tax=Dermatophagoides farinae TaxID=6954 RepID=A0A922I2S7_DERFA|nr:hypothetical protein DERF_007693 [Dermatophagoides farinae]